jgi:RNA polymerase sigma factor (sigma-70 family)
MSGWLYLQSLESPREESLLAAHEFAKLVENQTESVFVNIGNNASDEDRALVMDMLATLPMKERTVLEHTFLEGRTEREIAEFIGMSNSSVNRIKKRALRRLEAEFGERWSTHRIMRGHIIELPQPKRPKPKAA